jgi:hypothetical protein
MASIPRAYRILSVLRSAKGAHFVGLMSHFGRTTHAGGLMSVDRAKAEVEFQKREAPFDPKRTLRASQSGSNVGSCLFFKWCEL